MIELDRSFEIPEYSPVCVLCRNLEIGAVRRCRAFKEIPLPIWLGKNNHRKPYNGDNGIQFEAIDEEKAE